MQEEETQENTTICVFFLEFFQIVSYKVFIIFFEKLKNNLIHVELAQVLWYHLLIPIVISNYHQFLFLSQFCDVAKPVIIQ
jgi:ACR3 family arsenite efflux pump ArsB